MMNVHSDEGVRFFRADPESSFKTGVIFFLYRACQGTSSASACSEFPIEKVFVTDNNPVRSNGAWLFHHTRFAAHHSKTVSFTLGDTLNLLYILKYGSSASSGPTASVKNGVSYVGRISFARLTTMLIVSIASSFPSVRAGIVVALVRLLCISICF